MEDVKTTQLQIRIREDLKDELKIVANLKGLTTSALIHSLIMKAVAEVKAERPELFGLEHIPPHRSRFDVYAETFDGEALTESEWQFLEVLFKDRVDAFKQAKGKPPGHNLAPVVAELHKPVDPKDEIRKMIDIDEINEVERRTTPRKKKAS